MNDDKNITSDAWEVGSFICKGKRYAVILQTDPKIVAHTNKGGRLIQSQESLEQQGWRLMLEDQRRRLTGRR